MELARDDGIGVVEETITLGEQIARASESETDTRSLTNALVGLIGNGRSK